jgi:copper chaperone
MNEMSTGPHTEGSTTIRAASREGLERADLTIDGMKCDGCVARVERALLDLDGVERVLVALETGHAVIEYHPHEITASELREAINRVGFDTEHIHSPRLEGGTRFS